MAKNFSKFLGKVALMTAAALWAGCGDSEKKTEEPVALNSIKTVPSQNQNADVSHSQSLENVASSAKGAATADTLASENEAAESSASDSGVVAAMPKDSLLKKVVRIAKMKPEIGMIRALYGVIEEDMGRAVALYGVRPPREIIAPDGPREIHKPQPVPRCLVKELTGEDVVAGKDNDIDVEYFLNVFRQRSPGFRHICNKALYGKVSRTARTKEFNAKIVLSLKIAPGGFVEKAEIKSTTIDIKSNFKAINEDVKKSVSRWRFPKTQRGGTFTFPINLYEVIPSAASSASVEPLSPTE